MDIKEYIHSQLKASHSEKSCHSIISILFEDIPGFASFEKDEIDDIIIRILSGEPIQYITGRAPFYGYFFEVNRHVLIPRPETEELVYIIEKYIKKQDLKSCKILDIGTGSGCIPIVLSKLFPKYEVKGLDVSENALAVARKNNINLAASVDFIASDILNDNNWHQFKDFDIIISNPPYIPISEQQLMHTNVLDHEPHLALFVEDNDPILFYRKILSFALSASKKASIFLECNEYNAQDVVKIYSEFYTSHIIKDLQGKDRIVQATPLIK